MPLSKKVHEIEEQIRERIEQTVGELRQEILERVRDQGDQMWRQIETLSARLPQDLLHESALASLLREASEEAEKVEAGAPGTALAEMRDALVVLDRARSQSELLQTLLDQCGRLASRAAVFLVQPDHLQGWGGKGFEPGGTAVAGLSVEPREGSAWDRARGDEGAIRLSSAERAELSSRLEAPVPREAVVLPLVLRDRVAGVVYADRVGEDGPLPVEALQSLTYVTALALETLPLRKRQATSTLQVNTEQVSAEQLGAEQVSAEREPPPAPPAPPEAPADEPAVREVPAPEPAPESAAPPAAESAAPTAEPTPPVEAAPAIEEVEDVEVSPTEMGEVELEDMDLEEIDLDAEQEISLDDLSGVEPAETPAEPPREMPPEAPAVEEPPRTTPEEAFAEAAPPAAEEPATPAEPSSPPPAPAEPAEPSAAAAGPPPLESTRPGTEAPSPPPGQPLGAGAAGEGGAEVAPPSDIQGPGWAFSGGEEMDGDEEARHEEARRLARLLVSEIKLYNEEQVMEGRQGNDIFERLKDDIERSRQLYDARVDERVREKTDYFYQEMVRVLGAGDPKSLGI